MVQESEGHERPSNANRSEQSDGRSLVREIQHLVHDSFSGETVSGGLWKEWERGTIIIAVNMRIADFFSQGIVLTRAGHA